MTGDPEKDQPMISIVVLTYNREKLLRGCLESLFGQAYPSEKFEILVVDDGSADGTSALVSELSFRYANLKYIRQAHRGIPAARNNGIRHASGEIISIVADDYLLPPNYAKTIAVFFQKNPVAKVVRFKVVAADNRFLSRVSHLYYEASVRHRLCADQSFGGGSLFAKFKHSFLKIQIPEEKITTEHSLEAAGGAAFRKEVFDQVGLFDERLLRTEDTDMTLRLRNNGFLVYYCPFLHIKHRYSPYLVDTIKKNFHSGIHRYEYQKKHPSQILSFWSQFANKLQGLLLKPIWRARQADSLRDFFLYLPFMYVLEFAVVFGLLVGYLRSKTNRFKSVFKNSYGLK